MRTLEILDKILWEIAQLFYGIGEDWRGDQRPITYNMLNKGVIIMAKKDADKLLNGKIIISDVVKSAKQIEGTVDYIRELPEGMTVKEWKQMHKISDSLIIGEQENKVK